jgi:hypothetical protein
MLTQQLRLTATPPFVGAITAAGAATFPTAGDMTIWLQMAIADCRMGICENAARTVSAPNLPFTHSEDGDFGPVTTSLCCNPEHSKPCQTSIVERNSPKEGNGISTNCKNDVNIRMCKNVAVR